MAGQEIKKSLQTAIITKYNLGSQPRISEGGLKALSTLTSLLESFNQARATEQAPAMMKDAAVIKTKKKPADPLHELVKNAPKKNPRPRV